MKLKNSDIYNRIKKLNKLTILSLENALRLHEDAIYLYKKSRYPSAFLLSVLAQEEIGKMYGISDYVWSSLVNDHKWMLHESEVYKFFKKALFNHKSKQQLFIRSSISLDIDAFEKDKDLETRKQNAIYVGIKNGKYSNENLKGKINIPSKINKNRVEKQITKINDTFLSLGMGIRIGALGFEIEEIEKILKHKKILKKIFSNWQYMSGDTKKLLKGFQNSSNEKIFNI